MIQPEALKNAERQLQVPEQINRLDKEIECFREELHHFISRVHSVQRADVSTPEAGVPPEEQALPCELAEYLRQKSEQISTFRETVRHETSLLEI